MPPWLMNGSELFHVFLTVKDESRPIERRDLPPYRKACLSNRDVICDLFDAISNQGMNYCGSFYKFSDAEMKWLRSIDPEIRDAMEMDADKIERYRRDRQPLACADAPKELEP